MLKKLILLTALIASTNSFAGIQEDIVGKKLVVLTRALNLIEIESDSKYLLIETMDDQSYACEGSYAFKGEVFKGAVTCEDGRSFTQEIDMNGLTMETLAAGILVKVKSSLFDNLEVKLPAMTVDSFNPQALMVAVQRLLEIASGEI